MTAYCKLCNDMIIYEKSHKCDMKKIEEHIFLLVANNEKLKNTIKDLKRKNGELGFEKHKLIGRVKDLEKLIDKIRIKRKEIILK